MQRGYLDLSGSLYTFVVLIALVCGFGFLNEKVTKLTYEIALMLFSVGAGVIILLFAMLFKGNDPASVLAQFHYLDIEKFLMDGVLCFMLFAGSCRLKLSDFKQQARQVSVLAFVCTLLGACIYAAIFFFTGRLLNIGLSLPVCLIFGSITAPTDPIAATGILSKFGLPKKLSFLIEGESLFNDGVGVALFVCFSGMVTASSSGGFFAVMVRELFGAVLIGTVVTLVCFSMFRFTKSNTLGIFVSLLIVSLSYSLCELLGCSGAIASVICGLLFSTLRSRYCAGDSSEKKESFDQFWETLDVLLNSLLYVMLGLTFVHILQMDKVIILSLAAVLINLIARFGSVSVSSLFMGKLPDNYNRLNFVKLMTWGGLRGGLSVALAMSTREFLPEQTYYIILGGTYAIVFFTTVVQGLTMKQVYKNIDRSVKKSNK